MAWVSSASASQKPSSPNPLSVLFIDGFERDRQRSVAGLRAIDPRYVIYEAASSHDGLILYKSHPIDCVVLELYLIDASGFDVLETLIPSTVLLEIAIIVLTRFNHLSLLEVAKINGAYTALVKDFTAPMVLHESIVEAVASVEARICEPTRNP